MSIDLSPAAVISAGAVEYGIEYYPYPNQFEWFAVHWFDAEGLNVATQICGFDRVRLHAPPRVWSAENRASLHIRRIVSHATTQEASQ